MRRAFRAGTMFILGVGCAAISRAGEAPPVFRDISFDAALKEAAAQKKIVLADFTTPQCVPCKRMDLTTWLDPAVIALLGDKAVSLQINAFKEAKLAARYNINMYPTVLFVRPDRTAFDRLIGMQTAAEFISGFKDALAGKTSLQRARAAVAAAEAGGNAEATMKARKELAAVLGQEGDFAAALREYLWLFDDGMKKIDSFKGVRRSYVPMEINELGKSYPPALKALRERREAARAALAGPGFSDDDAADFGALNWALGENAATLRFFDALPPGDPRRPLLGGRVFGQLLEARRYADAARAQPAEKVRADFDRDAKQYWAPHPDEDAEMRRLNREFAVRNLAEGIEALSGAGNLEDSKGLIRRAREVEDSPWVREILLKHLKRAGRSAAGLIQEAQ